VQHASRFCTISPPVLHHDDVTSQMDDVVSMMQRSGGEPQSFSVAPAWPCSGACSILSPLSEVVRFAACSLARSGGSCSAAKELSGAQQACFLRVSAATQG